MYYRKGLILLFSLVSFFALPSFTHAAILFEDNFNGQADWSPKSKIAGNILGVCNAGAGTVSCASIGGAPTGWSAWRNSEFWNPFDASSPVALSHPTMQITGDAMYNLGAGNRAYVQWNESNKWGSGGDGWGADGILTKMLDTPEPEIYLQVKMKFPTDFKWHWDVNQNAGSLKNLRIAYYQNNIARPPYKSSSLYQGFQDGNLGPIYLLDFTHKEDPYAFRIANSNRCNPVNYNYVNYNNLSYRCIKDHVADSSNMPTGPAGSTYWSQTDGVGGSYNASYPAWTAGSSYRQDNYYCNESGHDASFWNQASPVFLNNGTQTNSFANTLGDGNWHKIKIHLKMNSAPGASDGFEEIWFDGYKSFSLTGLQWTSLFGDSQAGWNDIGIGGNAFNNYADTWRNANYNTWTAGSTAIYNGYQWLAIKDTADIPTSGDAASPDHNPTYWTKGAFVPSAEQWYAIDDVIISTTDIPANYVIGGADLAAPAAPTGLSVV